MGLKMRNMTLAVSSPQIRPVKGCSSQTFVKPPETMPHQEKKTLTKAGRKTCHRGYVWECCILVQIQAYRHTYVFENGHGGLVSELHRSVTARPPSCLDCLSVSVKWSRALTPVSRRLYLQALCAYQSRCRTASCLHVTAIPISPAQAA